MKKYRLFLAFAMLCSALMLMAASTSAARTSVNEDPGGGGGGSLYAPCGPAQNWTTTYMTANRFYYYDTPRYWTCKYVGNSYLAWDAPHGAYFKDPCWDAFWNAGTYSYCIKGDRTYDYPGWYGYAWTVS